MQQVAHWCPELVEKEHEAKQTAQILFFVMDKQTRNVATVIEAAYYTAAQKTFILVIDPYQGPGQIIQGERISQQYAITAALISMLINYNSFRFRFRLLIRVCLIVFGNRAEFGLFFNLNFQSETKFWLDCGRKCPLREGEGWIGPAACHAVTSIDRCTKLKYKMDFRSIFCCWYFQSVRLEN